MRVTVLARQAEGLEAKLLARTARQRQKVVAETAKSGERALRLVEELVPRDTSYMAEHTRLELFGDGNGYRVGWRASDFIGATNPVTGKRIDSFYPVFVTFGTRFMAGRDALTPALETERPEYLRGIARALSNA